ncbi:helix-turn-helix domain-containing protein [Tunicatimonas pelagia]|uniref:helix-turn-helix domain-containing protein n=1 Tax=Tunicatimonas pelagia TaxID=931531 RepID=UPI00266596E5|nr:helix-turn-helix domain-containing protein [Tunicatimonas pelagia]WKN42783.1 helix-turn-helix domain-containing protein [Tunicatimonas pelagia]
MGRTSKPLQLSTTDREDLKVYLSVGKRSARALRGAMTLKYLDEGLPIGRIEHLLDISRPTISQIRRRYLREGLETALCEKPRPGQPSKIGESEEAHITTLACSNPPEGRKQWTIRLLRDKVVELGYVETISRESVRKILKKSAQTLAQEAMVYR